MVTGGRSCSVLDYLLSVFVHGSSPDRRVGSIPSSLAPSFTTAVPFHLSNKQSTAHSTLPDSPPASECGLSSNMRDQGTFENIPKV